MGVIGTPRHINLIGQRFGRLEVIAPSNKRTAGRSMIWICKCDCGTIKEIAALSLRRGLVVSCGCYCKEVNIKKNTIHGHEKGNKKSPTYVSWEKMMSRCYKESDPAYYRYGGKGISVVEKWHHFEGFLEDMGERPSKEYTIDRIDSKGNYEPGNCRWATYKEQGNNTSRNVKFVYNGEYRTIAELADIAGIKYDTMYCRLMKYKWSIDNAMRKSVTKRNSRKGY